MCTTSVIGIEYPIHWSICIIAIDRSCKARDKDHIGYGLPLYRIVHCVTDTNACDFRLMPSDVEHTVARVTSSSPTMGYDFERFVSPVNEGLLCGICRDVLEDPVQASCEHAFCRSCIHGWLVHHNICPEDRRPLFASELRPLFRYMKNDLDMLQIRCRSWGAGCRVVCTLEHIQKHEEECEFHTLQCPSVGCTVMLERRDLEQHLTVCEFRKKECPKGCGMPILNRDDMEHNCIAELRTTLELLRSEMICKVEEQRYETDLRLDAQRRQMIEREGVFQSQVDELTVQVSRLLQEVQTLKEREKNHIKDQKTMELDRKELLEILKLTKMCRNCSRAEKIAAL